MYLGLIYLSAPNLYSHCPVSTDHKFVHLENSQFVDECVSAIGGEFRDINWKDNIQFLNNHLSSHSYNLTIGNRSIEQVEFLKSNFGSQVLTTCFNYTRLDYPRLLKDIAEYHVCNIDNTHSIEYYINAFDQQQLIPLEVDNSADVVVNLSDLNDLHLVREYIKCYGFELTSAAETYYNKWHNKYYE